MPPEDTRQAGSATDEKSARSGWGVNEPLRPAQDPRAAWNPPPGERAIPWRPSGGEPPGSAEAEADGSASASHDADDEHYVPPPPAPLPAGDIQFYAILAGLVGGPLLLLYLMIFNRDAPGWWLLLAVLGTIGGFGLLVSRLPAHRDDDDDNGARV